MYRLLQGVFIAASHRSEVYQAIGSQSCYCEVSVHAFSATQRSSLRCDESSVVLTSCVQLNEGKPAASHGDALHRKRVPLVHSAELKVFPQQRRLSREPTIKRKNDPRERSRKSCLEYLRKSSFYLLLHI